MLFLNLRLLQCFFSFQNSNTSSSSFCPGFLRGARPVFRRALFILWQKVYHLAIGGVHSTPAPPGYGPAYMVFFDSVCFLALQITSTEKHVIRCNLKKCIFHCKCKIGLVYNLYKIFWLCIHFNCLKMHDLCCALILLVQ